MSDLKPEVVEPDPAATSIPNDEPVNKAEGDSSAPTDVKAEEAEVKKDTTENGQNTDSKSEERGNASGGKREWKNNKPRGGGNFYKKPEKNLSKFDPSIMPASDDEGAIRAQVEFYFGDHNLPTDKFMWEMTDGSNNLPVKIAKIHSFKRMQRFQPYDLVVKALKGSLVLEVTGPEGSEEVKRKVPYNANQPGHARTSRTVYAKGFGNEEPTTQFDVEAFFTPYGPLNGVRLRRKEEDREFKGSVWVEFADEDLALKFLKLDPKPKWKGTEELKIQSKSDYLNEKDQMIKDGTMQPSESRPQWRGDRPQRGRGNFRDRGDRGDGGDRDPNDWKKRRNDDQKNGFRDRKGGRGGRGRGNRDRNDRGGDRRRDRDDRDDRKGDEVKSEVKAETKDTKEDATKGEADANGESKKRAREDDGATEAQGPAKKVDTKEEAS